MRLEEEEGRLTAEETKNLLGQIFAGGTALAGLVLVFLGSVLASYDSFEPTARRAIKSKYQWRAWLAFAGFAFSLIAAACGLIGLIIGPSTCLVLGIIALAAAGLLLLAMGFLSALEV